MLSETVCRKGSMLMSQLRPSFPSKRDLQRDRLGKWHPSAPAGAVPEQSRGHQLHQSDLQRNWAISIAVRLQGLSLNIPAGTSCALVGTSGSGKSTVLRLLFRFYEPDSGTLSVAGRDVTDYTMKSLRAKIGEVSQLFKVLPCAASIPVATGFAGGLLPQQAAPLRMPVQHRGVQVKKGPYIHIRRLLAGLRTLWKPF